MSGDAYHTKVTFTVEGPGASGLAAMHKMFPSHGPMGRCPHHTTPVTLTTQIDQVPYTKEMSAGLSKMLPYPALTTNEICIPDPSVEKLIYPDTSMLLRY